MVTPENRSQSERAKMRELKSPGEQLRQAREAIGASLSVVASRTRISETTLFHLEHDMYDEFAVELFLKGHLRSYAREVGLDSEAIIQSYEKFVGIEAPLPSQDPEAYTVETADFPRPESLSVPSLTIPETSSTEKFRPLSAAQSPSNAAILDPKISEAALSGKHRKVIGRHSSQSNKKNVRRGPHAGVVATGSNSGVRLTKPILLIADRLFTKPAAELTTAEASAPIIRQRLNGVPLANSTAAANGNGTKPLRRSSQSSFRTEAVQPRSKLERAIPQLKEFGAKHYLAIIVFVVLSMITAGLLSGNRADAQDPAKFPKNSQDSWELERQADQTRWLLEQPDEVAAKKIQHDD